MCVVHRIGCSCGGEQAEMSMLDELLGPDAVKRVYCPQCSGGLEFDGSRMLADNGWVIEYDMDAACACAPRAGLAPDEVKPEFIFDEGYCAWTGYTPVDIDAARQEKAEVLKLMKTDFKAYVDALMSWGVKRAERLAREGWRKAKAASVNGS